MDPFHEFNILLKRGFINKETPDFILNNLNPEFKLRDYQKEALAFFSYYWEEEEDVKPIQLLYHMATGSGKTLIMAANILYLYKKGYRDFVFFVNNSNVLDKTKDNFLNHLSSKYLFAEKIVIDEKEILIKTVENLDSANNEDINILFTTVQGLHSKLNQPRENSITYEDFKENKIVLISDEAHHINALTKTKNKLNKTERTDLNSWENTVNQIHRSNKENVLVEFTATAQLDHPAIKNKYENKVLYQYSLKEFRRDGFSKEVDVLQVDLEPIDRSLQAVLISQYRRKIAEKHGISLKPVILMKSKTIEESKSFEEEFRQKIDHLTSDILNQIKATANVTIIKKAFDYFDQNDIKLYNLVRELKEDFSVEKCLSINTKNESEDKQLTVNSLEDKNNEIRVIFAVDKLNEGWDVLNLFDIVRLYETRDSRGRRPGPTTVAEAQLIGRGARYFPFQLNEFDAKYKRKYDEDIENELRVLEVLYYHSSHNPRYIYELHQALVDTGIMAEEPKEIDLIVKDSFKKSYFWKNGLLFSNKYVKNDRKDVIGLNNININSIYSYKLATGQSSDSVIFDDDTQSGIETVSKNYKLLDFGKSVIRKATQNLTFYNFSNLLRYFPNLTSISEFISSNEFLGFITVDITGNANHLQTLNSKQKLEITIDVLKKISRDIQRESKEYIGTREFLGYPVSDYVKNKKIKVSINENSDQEFGYGMREPRNPDLYLDLSQKNWYVYNDNFGTSEEKYLTKFINDNIDQLYENYESIYLLRNEKIFQIYRFSDGAALEPDFLLMLAEKNSENPILFQLFIEAKGGHLLEKDKWKEEFLNEIENSYKIYILHQNDSFKLYGMPFYNEELKKEEFKEKFDAVLDLN